MSRYPAQPERLVDLPAERDLVGVSALVRAAAAPPREISPAARQRMRSRLRCTFAEHRRVFHLRWRLALVLVFTLAVGGVVGAATLSAIARRLSRDEGVVHAADPAVAVSPQAIRRRAIYTPVAAAVPAREDLPMVTNSVENPAVPAAANRPGTVRLARRDPAPRPLPGPPPPPVAPVSPAPPSPVAVEQALLADILKLLRAEHRPEAALALLNEHAERFPDTVLAPEAGMFRAEALLGLGRKTEALSILDGLPLASMPSRNECLVLRGELRSAAGRWQEAQADFEMPLSASKSAIDARSRASVERALWGRASARSHLGDEAGARADLASYLREFPSGRFSAQAAALLGARP